VCENLILYVLELEIMLPVCSELCAWKNQSPEWIVGCSCEPIKVSGSVYSMDLTTLWKITQEVLSVNFNLLQITRGASKTAINKTRRKSFPKFLQLDDSPVFVALGTTAFSFPTVSHILPSARQNEVRANSVVLIWYAKYSTSSEDMC